MGKRATEDQDGWPHKIAGLTGKVKGKFVFNYLDNVSRVEVTVLITLVN